MYPISSGDESWFPVFEWRAKPAFHKYLKRRLPSAISIWERPWVFCLNGNGHRDALTRKKTGFPCSGLNTGSSFISEYKGTSEYPVQTLEKALDLLLVWTGGLTSLWHLKRHVEFKASKGDVAWLFLKIDRNHNITVATRKGHLVSRLNSKSIHIALLSLVEIPEVSLITKQKSWHRWTNTSFEGLTQL